MYYKHFFLKKMWADSTEISPIIKCGPREYMHTCTVFLVAFYKVNCHCYAEIYVTVQESSKYVENIPKRFPKRIL